MQKYPAGFNTIMLPAYHLQLNPDSDGSGLGLALVKKIASIYQGRIWVESDYTGKECCFMLTLPGTLKRGKENE